MNIDVGAWPGTEIVEITRLNAAATVLLNRCHLFMTDVYVPITEVANGDWTVSISS